jgi:hypothetical protein
MSRPDLASVHVDTTRLPLLLGDLRLPAIGRFWPGPVTVSSGTAATQNGVVPRRPGVPKWRATDSSNSM